MNDSLGHLSMWRAHGGATSGAALVSGSDVFDDAQMPLLSFASPVLDGNIEEFAPELEAFIDRLNPAQALRRDVIFRCGKQITCRYASGMKDSFWTTTVP